MPIKSMIWIVLFLPIAAMAESGIASWYGYPYHGRKAANGSTYSMYEMTAAHRTLPFGTCVTVTTDAGKQVQVTITDRGPFVPGRIVDLSWAAAVALGIQKKGIAEVRLTKCRV